MKTPRLMLVTFAAASSLTMVVPIFAAPENEAASQAPASEQAFSGKVDSINSTERTFTVSGKLIYVNDSTQFAKAGKAITFSDIKVGDKVSGMSHRTFDGNTEAKSVIVDDEASQPPKPQSDSNLNDSDSNTDTDYIE